MGKGWRFIGLAATLLIGCAGLPDRSEPSGDSQGLNPISRRNRYPKGSTVPPATFGVDLVGYAEKPATASSPSANETSADPRDRAARAIWNPTTGPSRHDER